MNRVRLTLIEAPWDLTADRRAAVQVEIDGTTLEVLVSRVSRDQVSGVPPSPADVLWPGRELWLGHPHDEASAPGDDVRVPVLVCNCGVDGCGGVAARIEVANGEVRWSDFASVPTLEPLAIGVFRFPEAKFRDQVERLMDRWRREWRSR